MNLLTKVLEVNGEKTEKFDDNFLGEEIHLYPKGTTRVVRTYLLFPRDIAGERVRGRCILEQVADIDITISFTEGEYMHYNKWENKRVIYKI